LVLLPSRCNLRKQSMRTSGFLHLGHRPGLVPSPTQGNHQPPVRILAAEDGEGDVDEHKPEKGDSVALDRRDSVQIPEHYLDDKEAEENEPRALDDGPDRSEKEGRQRESLAQGEIAELRAAKQADGILGNKFH